GGRTGPGGGHGRPVVVPAGPDVLQRRSHAGEVPGAHALLRRPPGTGGYHGRRGRALPDGRRSARPRPRRGGPGRCHRRGGGARAEDKTGHAVTAATLTRTSTPMPHATSVASVGIRRGRSGSKAMGGS